MAGTRLVLAFSALTIILIDPAEPDRFVVASYAALITYSFFSLVIYLAVGLSRERLLPSVLTNPYWIDVIWYLALIFLTSGTNSIFFFFFYFAILNASNFDGFKSGLAVTVASSVGFSVLGIITPHPGVEFELDRFLLRSLSLLLLGFLISYWGGLQSRTFARLNLLRDITHFSNPRFGADRTIADNLELIRAFFNADACLLVTTNKTSGQSHLCKADLSSRGLPLQETILEGQLAQQMLQPFDDSLVFFDSSRFRSFLPPKNVAYLDKRLDKFVGVTDVRPFTALAQILEAASFITVPIRYDTNITARVFVYSTKKSTFGLSDLKFLRQAVDHFSPIVQNIRLVDHLASTAADEERKKMARDIHDSIIQPYIGLQMGIESLAAVLSSDNSRNGDASSVAAVSEKVGRLQELTARGIADLRNYISDLSDGRRSGENLAASVRQFAKKFSAATGIRIEIESPEHFEMPHGLTHEVFQIVAEGLSNIRRHTNSPEAHINFAVDAAVFTLTISNLVESDARIPFVPRSISERAASLGGTFEVSQTETQTIIRVEVPL